MAGDVNLFFNDLDDQSVCEVEVMIAEERWRRKGLAREALLMIMRYGGKGCDIHHESVGFLSQSGSNEP